MATYNLKLIKKEIIAEDVILLDFIREENQKKNAETGAIPFTPGQYMNLYISSSHFGTPGGHTGRSYTLLSLPEKSTSKTTAQNVTQNVLQFAIRKRGEFSRAMHNLPLGEIVIADGPHGDLCPTPKTSDGLKDELRSFICLAAGIGVAPFVEWIRSTPTAKPDSKKNPSVHILVSNSSEKRAPFLAELFDKAKSDPKHISVTSFITQQSSQKGHTGRIQTSDVRDALTALPDAHVAICGSINFTRDMWRIARELGVTEERIFTEAFY